MSALIQNEETDYTLSPPHGSCWITVDTVSVYIRRTDEGVSVDLFPKGREMNDSLAGAWATFAEADLEEEA